MPSMASTGPAIRFFSPTGQAEHFRLQNRHVTVRGLVSVVTGAFRDISSGAEREVPCYQPESFPNNWIRNSLRKHVVLWLIMTHLLTGRTQSSY